MAGESRSKATPILLDERVRFTLVELCDICRVTADTVIEVVEEGILEPEGPDFRHWRFRAADLRRLQTALRLQRDLRVNLAGAALALQLLEEVEALRARLARDAW
jgi:chaperone modulatory protein CbpM